MDSLITDDRLRRTSSNTSTSSSRVSSAKGRRRLRPRKTTSNASLQQPAASDKSFTSFPSLSPSPDASPVASRANGFPIPEPQLSSPGLPDPPTIRKASKSVQSLVGNLVSASPAPKDRTALFDDAPQDARSVPGNLHHADDDTVRRLLASRSPIGLVKQLATDLARRDAQVTALRRRAEERERILRRMLLECEVSNLDIETRLKELDRGYRPVQGGDGAEDTKAKRRSTVDFDFAHPDDPMDRHLARALAENDDSRRELMEDDDNSALVPFPSLGDASYPGSINSTESYPGKPKENGKGWKSYIWSGTVTKRESKAPSLASNNEDEFSGQTRSRASSGAQKRKSLNTDTFVPPFQSSGKNLGAVSSLRRLGSEERSGSDVASRRSSGGSVASWALRMVAGNNQTNGDRQGTFRGRQASERMTRPTNGSGPNGRGRTARLSLGPNGTIKSVSPESSRANSGLHPGSPPPTTRSSSNLGPVEMDMILPEESRPPTLLQHHNTMSDSAEYLTDRFGFIYDQRRKRRQAEAAAAIKKNRRHTKIESLGNAKDMLRSLAEDASKTDNENEEPNSARPASVRSQESETQPTKRWQDYLKLATFPTELLSHTPSAAPITAVEVDEPLPKGPQVSVLKRGSVPASSTNPMPAPTRVSSSNAEFAQASATASDPIATLNNVQPDPVKALLEQLTELHDSLQQSKTVKWNDFLRRVRAERKREGDAVAASEGRSKNAMPEALITDGEIIGIAGLGNKGKVGRAKWKELKSLVLGGIPVHYRAKIWAECSGANGLRIPGYYEDLVNNGVDDPEIVSQIQMDINRTLTDNIYFRRGPGVQKLREVLLAYSRRNPAVGYCQGMNLITACLLLIMPTAEDAFWVLATMIENILPDSYYDHSLLASRADQQVLRQYVAELLPRLSAHFDQLGIELEALTFQWFLSVFTDCLSAEALFRVWDVVLCMHDGATFLFQVALALLKLNEHQLLTHCDSPAAVYHYINQQMTNHAISIDGLVQASDALKKTVRRKDVEERRLRAIEAEQELMRQRALLRAERLSKIQGADPAASDQVEQQQQPQPTVLVDEDDAAAGQIVSSPGPASTAGSSRDVDEDELVDALEEVRTPMPIDEEALWRA
ncbi:TBC-domain-containing protein [Saccharata proteae CBS 121410]|uniref:TBC-domain-containing protein n=1 Tax=Saccharata proteae CBS 121410 TaxID=1314787 RepID=A0A6A5YB45_9PEZI|nr:TBC-domain-containing protein [Saccharata proteae CBS 121410]